MGPGGSSGDRFSGTCVVAGPGGIAWVLRGGFECFQWVVGFVWLIFVGFGRGRFGLRGFGDEWVPDRVGWEVRLGCGFGLRLGFGLEGWF